MTILYAVTLMLSAFLVFWVQPLVARMLLPALGGSPQVWNTCVLFFQGMLLLGYLYSHGLTRKLSLRSQGVIHLAVFVIAVLVVPGGPAQWTPPEHGSVVLWLIARLLLYVGLPYAVLSSSAPLLQHWFHVSGNKGARDPYFLYAASNFGSLLALVLFPSTLERYLKISQQASYWRVLFLVLAVAVFVCLAFVWKAPGLARAKGSEGPSADDPNVRLTRKQIGRYVGLAFVPSSLMLGVTTHITTDIAAVSFLWVLPLALYLGTFIAAFSKVGARLARYATLLLPVPAFVAVAILLREGSHSLWLVPLELAVVTLVSMVLHRRLYDARPEASELTTFYLWVSFGGFLGGLLNGFLAPFLFNRILEYPLVLALGYVLVEWPVIVRIATTWKSASWHGLGLQEVGAVAAVAFGFAWFVASGSDPTRLVLVSLMVATSSLAAVFALGPQTASRLVVMLGLFIYLGFPIVAFRGTLHADRSFFGAFMVEDSNEGGVEMRLFSHGTTVHGVQAKDPAQALKVTSYYATVADIFTDYLESRGPAAVGVTGLGAGNLACIGKDRDQVTFFEIDPAVEEVAREYFTYLDQCSPEIDVVLGDARLRLADIPDGAYDLLILDAFSSDSVPIHLLTDEAAELYERVLQKDGLLAFHISNRYLDLQPVLERLATHRGWKAYEVTNDRSSVDPTAKPSTFVLASRNDLVHDLLDGVEGAVPLEQNAGFKLWTDDYASVLSVLRW